MFGEMLLFCCQLKFSAWPKRSNPIGVDLEVSLAEVVEPTTDLKKCQASKKRRKYRT